MTRALPYFTLPNLILQECVALINLPLAAIAPIWTRSRADISTCRDSVREIPVTELTGLAGLQAL